MRRFLAFALLGFATGCIPVRDNVLDSSHAPAAELFVTDSGVESACGTESTTLTVYSSRGRCLSLDASGSSDPQGTPDASLSFTYSYEEPDGSLVELGTGGAVFELAPAFKRALPPQVPHTFHVQVVDPSGARGRAETVFTFDNGAPSAPGFSPRTLPVGGFAGSSAATFTVELDGRGATDPDGDDLTYHWKFLGAVIETSGEAIVARDIPVDVEERYLAELVVSDGVLESTPSVAEIAVRTPNLWLGGGDGTTIFRRLDSLRAPVHLPGAVPGDENVRVAAFGADLVAASYADSSLGSVVAILDRATSAILTGPVPLTDSAESIAVDEQNGVLFVLEKTTPRLVSRWDLTTLAPMGSYSVPEILDESGIDSTIEVAGDGTAWIVGIFGRGAYRIDSFGDISPAFSIDDARWVTGVAARPGTSEVWTLETPDVFGAGEGVAELVRNAPGENPVRHLVGGTYATGLVFADADRVWITVPDVGLVLVDVRPLDPLAADLSFGIERVVPEVQNALLLLADRETGTCWASSFANVAYRVGRDFTVASVTNLLDRTLFFVDPDGALWFLAGDDVAVIEKGHGPSLEGTLASVFTTASDQAAVDPSTGGLLVRRLFPPALLRYSETGKLDRVLDIVLTEAGDLIAVPNVEAVRVSPDGSALWARTLPDRALVRFDITTSLPYLQEILTPAEVSASFSDGFAYVPAAGNASIWSVTDSSTPEIVEADSLGIHPHAILGATETLPYFALAPETGRLCVLTTDPVVSDDTVRIRLLEEGETAPLTQVDVLLASTSQQLIAAGASSDSVNGDVCWGVFTRNGDASCGSPRGETLVRAWRASDGQLVDSYDDLTVFARDVSFVSKDVFWLVTDRCDGPSSRPSYSVVRRNAADAFEAHVLDGEATSEFLPLLGSH